MGLLTLLVSQVTYLSPVSGTWAGHDDNVFHAGRNVWGGVAHRWHSGVDINAVNGSPVVATIGGRVLYSGYSQGYNNQVVVLGDDGNVFRYAVHGGYNVKAGQYVNAGEQIGVIGRNHLHLEIIPPQSYAYSMFIDPKNLGKPILGGGTKTRVGQVIGPTVDALKFFGAQRFATMEVGTPIGDPQRREVVQVVDNGGVPTSDTFGEVRQQQLVNDAKLLAGVMLAEARGAGPDAMKRVGSVALNRLDDNTGMFPNKLSNVLRQQFAPPLPMSKLGDVEKPLATIAYTTALGLLNRTIAPNTDALWFATPQAAKANADFRRITQVQPFVEQDAAHVFYGKVNYLPPAMTAKEVPQFGQALRVLSQETPEEAARRINPRIIADANFAAERAGASTVDEDNPAPSYRGQPDARRLRPEAPPAEEVPVATGRLAPTRVVTVPEKNQAPLSELPLGEETPAAQAVRAVATREPIQPASKTSMPTDIETLGKKAEKTLSSDEIRRLAGAGYIYQTANLDRPMTAPGVLPGQTPGFQKWISNPDTYKEVHSDFLKSGEKDAVRFAERRFQSLNEPPSAGAALDLSAPTQTSTPTETPKLSTPFAVAAKPAQAAPTVTDLVMSPSPLNVQTPGIPSPVEMASAMAQQSPDAGAALSTINDLPAAYHPQATLDLTPSAPSADAAPVESKPPMVIQPKPPTPPPMRVGVQPQYNRPSGAPQTSLPSSGQSSNALVQASGGGRPETTPMGNQIAVHTHPDGGVTTSYYSSDGRVITIHTDANGDTQTLSGA